MPELERFMLARLAELDAQVREGYGAFDFNRVTATLFNFCTNELSAFYFDIRKDVLYCDARPAARRRAARTVMDEIFRRVVTWFAPILCFTMEEAWLSRFPAKTKACICRSSSTVPARLDESGADREMEAHARTAPRRHRRAGIGARRQEDRLQPGSRAHALCRRCSRCRDPGFDAALTKWRSLRASALSTGDAPEGAFTLADVKGVAAVATLSDGEKCARCWRVLPEVGSHKDHPDVCDRCDAAVEQAPGMTKDLPARMGPGRGGGGADRRPGLEIRAALWRGFPAHGARARPSPSCLFLIW